MENRGQMNNTTSLKALSLAELTMVAGGIIIDDDDDGSNETTNEHDGSPEPGSGDRDIGVK